MKYIGIDISQAQLDIDALGQSIQVANQPEPIEIWLTTQDRGETILVCEALGGYERTLVDICHPFSIPIHVAHANRVRSDAKACGQ